MIGTNTGSVMNCKRTEQYDKIICNKHKSKFRYMGKMLEDGKNVQSLKIGYFLHSNLKICRFSGVINIP